MSRWLKLIWFAELPWTRYHAAVGINAEKTRCGITRSTRAILPSEKSNRIGFDTGGKEDCLKCLAVLRHRYGQENIVEVKVE